jgi:hypothetical protein
MSGAGILFCYSKLIYMMEVPTNIHVESARLQKAIEDYLGMKKSSLIFDFHTVEGNKVKLDLITVNPRHNQSFLYHSEIGYDKVDVLGKMLDYIKTHKEKENSYTVQWAVHGEKELQTSYFRAKNIYDALDKLYYGRDVNAITVFSVVMNPIS